jgi:hypothetical protein
MKIIGNLCEITEIIWLTKEVSRMLSNSYGIYQIDFGNQDGLAGFLG